MDPLQISYPPDLPVSARRDEILAAIRDHQVVIIAGATGSGKTTQIPKMCLELGRTSIAHTQPRRIAARAVAERIAEELKAEIGGLVGYQVRFTDQAGPETMVKVMTDGILLNALQRDRTLKQYDTIIIDEAHERSLNIDFLLGYLKQILPQRPDLKLIITSATIDPGAFSRHFDNAPMIEVSGRTFPIEIRYRPIVADKTAGDDMDDESGGGKPVAEPTAGDYIDGIVSALKELEREAPGDVLVFLSGESEIKDAQEAIEGGIIAGQLQKGTEVLPLYGRLSAADQHRVFEPSKMVGVRRRVILSTNVAETSLTVPGIRYVIDAGTARISRYSPRAKVQRLPIEPISQASANQRSGRCGRTSEGIAMRLYSEDDFNKRPEFTDPEILRTNLASVILQAASLGLGDITAFPFLQKPDSRGVKDGLGLLRELGAVEGTVTSVSRLTKVGRDLARLPIEPRFARMVIESRSHNVTREVMAIVAGLTVQDPRERPLEKREKATLAHARFADPTSDFLTLLNLWNYLEEKQRELSSSAFRRLCKAEFLNYLRVREWQDVYRQLRSLTKPIGLTIGEPRIDPDGIHKSLLSGLLSHLGLRQLSEKKAGDKAKAGAGNRELKKPVSNEYLGASNQKFVIFPGSTLAKKPPAAIMSAELVETSRLFARMNAAIDPAWAESLAGDLCKRQYSEPHWEKSQGAVVAYERVTLFGVPIVAHRRMQFSRIDAGHCRYLFIRHALVEGEWDSVQPFDRQNRALIKDLADSAERSRNPQALPDQEDMFRFYAARIPDEVVSSRSFEGWWKKARHATPNLLTMTRQELLGEDAVQHDERDFPHEWSSHGQLLKLQYRFVPGELDDGVTVEVPVALLAGLDAEPFAWLVPGLRLELVTALIKSLPKNIRRQVVPAADWAAKALAAMPEVPNGNLLAVVAETLQRLSGALVTSADFDTERLATGLKMTYKVVDSKGKKLAVDTNLANLQTTLGNQARQAVAAVAQRANSPIEKTNLTNWDFDDLPQSIESRHGANVVRAFPALLAEKSGISIKLFTTQAQQFHIHPLGTRALVLKSIPSPAKYVQEHLTASENLALAQLQYHSFNAFIDDVIAACTDQKLYELAPDGMFYTKAEFNKLRDAVQASVMDTTFATVELVAKIMVASREAAKAISTVKAFELLSVLAAEKAHIAELLAPGFVSRVGLARLPRVLIYLRAITLRIERMAENPARDRAAWVEFEQAWSAFVAAGGSIPLPPMSAQKLVKARWMLEELRVSLFAQTLGTPEAISVQRIKKVLG
jgi:ATP-dependent helicase HrpA